MKLCIGCRQRSDLCPRCRVGTLQETKDIETTVAGIRADKVKAEAAEKAAKLKGAQLLWL